MSTPIILPALVVLKFKGVSEYLEDLLAWINVPILDSVHIAFFNQLIFSTSQLPRLVHHAKGLKKLKGALIVLCDHFVEITLFRKANVDAHHINLRISCTGPDWRLESLTQVCNSILPPLSSLHIIDDLHYQPLWQDMENTQWLEFLRQFATVKLYLSEQFTLRLGAALPELTSEKGANVLPRLQLLFLTARTGGDRGLSGMRSSNSLPPLVGWGVPQKRTCATPTISICSRCAGGQYVNDRRLLLLSVLLSFDFMALVLHLYSFSETLTPETSAIVLLLAHSVS